MSVKRYYFPDLTGHPSLCYVAKLAKQTFMEGDDSLKIYLKNHDILYVQSPGQFDFLVRENDPSIIDWSPGNSVTGKRQKENISPTTKSCQELLTPVKRNTSLPRKYLSVDEAEEETSVAEKSKIKIIDIHRRINFSHENTPRRVFNPTAYEADTKEKAFVSPATFSYPKRTVNRDEKNKESPNSSETATRTAHLNQNVAADEMFISPTSSKVIRNPDAGNQESPRSAQTTAMLASLNVDDNVSSKLDNVSKKADSSGDIEELSDSPRQIAKNLGNKFMEKTDSVDLDEELNIPNLIRNVKNTPSPIKRTKINCSLNTDVQVFITSNKNTEINFDSSEDARLPGIPIIGNKMDDSLLGDSKTISIPRRNTSIFKSIPRIICSDGMEELDFELPSESEESPSRESSTVSRNYRLGKTATRGIDDISSAKESIKSYIFDKSSPSPRQLSPGGKYTCIRSPQSAGNTNNPIEDRSCIPRKTLSPSTRPSKAISPRSESSPSPRQISPTGKDTFVRSPQSVGNTNSPIEDRSCVPRKMLSPSAIPSKAISPRAEISPSTRKLSPAGKDTCVRSSQSAGNTNSPIEDERCFPRKTLSPHARSSIAISPRSEGSPSPRQLSPAGKHTCVRSPHSPVEDRGCVPRKTLSTHATYARPSKASSPRSEISFSPRQLSPAGNDTFFRFPQSAGNTNSPVEDKCCIPRKTLSPSARPSKATSPKSLGRQVSSIEKKTYVGSPQSLSKTNSPETDVISRKRPSPSARTSNELMLQNSFDCQLSHSEKKTCINYPQSVAKTNSPCKIKDHLRRQISPSGSPLKAQISAEDPFDSNKIFKKLQHSDASIINRFVNKLTGHISQRDDYLNMAFESFCEFQKDLTCLFLYAKKVAFVVEKISKEGKEYVTDNFKTVVADLTKITSDFTEKLNAWKLTGDSEVQTWIQCFEVIKKLKSQFEIFSNADATPVEYMRFLRVYESDLKTMWKKMDDLKMVEEARRLLFFKSAFIFERLIKQFNKCLIIIGIVKVRPQTSTT